MLRDAESFQAVALPLWLASSLPCCPGPPGSLSKSFYPVNLSLKIEAGLNSRLEVRTGVFFSFFFCFVFVFLLFRAARTAYGSSQARGQTRATAASPHHSHAGSELYLCCDLHHSSPQGWILNLWSKTRDQTHILIDISRIPFFWAMTRPPKNAF